MFGTLCKTVVTSRVPQRVSTDKKKPAGLLQTGFTCTNQP
jgi:hypothetical protein